MIVFTKQPDGTWAKTGDQLPTEIHMQILIDADAKPMNGIYTYPEAIKMVEDTISKGAGDHYRYEITSASAKALSRAGIRKKADETIARILDTAEPPAKPKTKATPKPKAVKKAPKAKAPTREEKRAAIIATPKFQKAYAKAKEKTDRKECAHGHKITPENTHFGDLFRTGLITCDPCNIKAQTRYAKKLEKK